MSTKCDKTEAQNVILYLYDPKCHIFVSINSVFLRYLDASGSVLIVVLQFPELPCFSRYSKRLKEGICI